MDYPGEKLLIKLWETLAEKGVGSLLQPWHEIRLGKARNEIRRDEMLLLAQAEKEVADIKAGRSTYTLQEDRKLITGPSSQSDQRGRIEPTLDLAKLSFRAEQVEMSEAVRKEVNVAKAIVVAETLLENDAQEPPEATIDDDWLFEWRDSAGRVSSSELQDLWGRVLAGETKKPGSYSLRALAFLRGLSKSEAELISKVAKFVIGGRVYRNKEKFLEKEGVQFAQLLFLQDIGILSGVEALGLSTTYKSRESDRFFLPLFANNKVILVEHEDAEKTIDVEIFLITNMGNEILRLASFEVDEEYLASVAKDYANKEFTVQVADWHQLTPEKGRFYNPVKIDA